MRTLHEDSMFTAVPVLASIDHDHHVIEISTIDRDGVRSLGTFDNAADAWRAVDEIDCPELFR